MLADHVGGVFLPQYPLLRIVGRISFPLFIFFLVEGFTHTKSRTRYFLRLLVFALLSEIPFDMAFRLSADEIRSGMFTTFEKQNVMWTLLFGFLFMAAYEGIEGALSDDGRPMDLVHLLLPLILSSPVLVLAICGAEWMKTDYHGYGVAAIAACFLLKQWCAPVWLSPAPVAFILQTNPAWETEGYAAFALPVLFFYNGTKGRNLPKYFFYAFYPVHLLLLAAAKAAM